MSAQAPEQAPEQAADQAPAQPWLLTRQVADQAVMETAAHLSGDLSQAEAHVVARYLLSNSASSVVEHQNHVFAVAGAELWNRATGLPGTDLAAQALALSGPIEDTVDLTNMCAELREHLEYQLAASYHPPSSAAPAARPSAGEPGDEDEEPPFPDEFYGAGLDVMVTAVCRALAAHLISLHAPGLPRIELPGQPARSLVRAACPACGESELTEAGHTLGPNREDHPPIGFDWEAFADSHPEIDPDDLEDSWVPHLWSLPLSALSASQDKLSLSEVNRLVLELWAAHHVSSERVTCNGCNESGAALGFVLPWTGVPE